MAKKKTSELDQARTELKAAQKLYGKTARKATGKMDAEQLTEHQVSCRTALADKRYAAAAVDALAAGRQVPDRQSIKEAAVG